YSVSFWIGVAVLATVFSLDVGLSFWSNFERMEGLITFLYLFAYFIVLSSFLNKKLWYWFLNASLGVSLLVCFIALFQYFKISSLTEVFNVSSNSFRLDSTFGNPTYLAVYCLFHIFIAGFLYKSSDIKLTGLKVFYVFSALLNFFVLYQTGTRGTLIGLLLGSLLTAVLWAVFGGQYRRERKIALIFLSAVVFLMVSFFIIKDSGFVHSNQSLSRFANVALLDTFTKAHSIVWEMA